MALTINTHPNEVITNAPKFNVTSTLNESASIQNLRVRAKVYIRGYDDPQMQFEQAKGLDDWDLYEALRKFVHKRDNSVPNSSVRITSFVSSELLSSWTQYDGFMTTFNTSGRQIISAITGGATRDWAQSNDLGTAARGDVFVVGVENNYTDTGTVKAELSYGDDPSTVIHKQQYAGLNYGELIPNHIYFFMAIGNDASPHINIGNPSPGLNFSGTFTVHKITDTKDDPGVFFWVCFEEVYENALGITTVSDTEYADCMLFVPVKVRPGESFSDYLNITAGAEKKFLTRAEDGDVVYKHNAGMELRAMFLTVCPWLRIRVTPDAAYTQVYNVVGTGWGFVVVNDSVINVDGDDETLELHVASQQSYGGADAGVVANMTINCDRKCYGDLRVLSFVGDLGEETILFRALPSENGRVTKEFYKTQSRIRKVLKVYARTNMILRTTYESEGLRRLLHQLISTDLPVWMFDPDMYDNYRVVTVISDDVPILDQDELIENEIEIEYEI